MDIYEKRREMPDVTEGGDSGDVDGSPEYMSQPSRNWFDTGEFTVSNNPYFGPHLPNYYFHRQ